MNWVSLSAHIGSIMLALNIGLFAALGSLQLFNLKLSERNLRRAIEACLTLQLILACSLSVSLAADGGAPAEITFGHLLHVRHFELPIAFLFEPASSYYLIVAELILLISIHFSSAYLHRESGLQRFMMLMSLCQLGVFFVLTSRHLSFLFVGWECVGIASTLLICFFSRNPSAARRSAKAFSAYRISDMGLILAAALLHTSLKSDDLLNHHLVGAGGEQGAVIGAALALICGSLAKGSVFPFMTWMPQAVEGPTPSSAVFYGALSVHLAPMLLLRTFHIWHDIFLVRYTVMGLGVVTAILGASIGRTQSNAKTQLVYAVMAQIGVMYVELSFGWTKLVILHMCSHALLRTYQFLRSGNLLVEFHQGFSMDNPRTSKGIPWLEAMIAPVQKPSWFLHAWNGFYLEAIARRVLMIPIQWLAHSCLRCMTLATNTTAAAIDRYHKEK